MIQHFYAINDESRLWQIQFEIPSNLNFLCKIITSLKFFMSFQQICKCSIKVKSARKPRIRNKRKIAYQFITITSLLENWFWIQVKCSFFDSFTIYSDSSFSLVHTEKWDSKLSWVWRANQLTKFCLRFSFCHLRITRAELYRHSTAKISWRIVQLLGDSQSFAQLRHFSILHVIDNVEIQAQITN